MQFLKPLTALRLLAVLTTVALAAAVFVPRGASLLIGCALGLSMGVQVMAWKSELHWHDPSEPGHTAPINLARPRR